MYEWIIVIYLKYKKVQKFREIIFHIKNSAKKVQFDIWYFLPINQIFWNFPF